MAIPLLPMHHVSCVARINSGIPPIDNEKLSSGRNLRKSVKLIKINNGVTVKN
jgi:hypothetical protein